MRKLAQVASLNCAIGCAISCAITCICGCAPDTLKTIFPSSELTLPNNVALTHALQLSSLPESEHPFHLLLDITPPAQSSAPNTADMRAQVEIYWLNRLTYRTVIHSSQFTQIRIVNGPTVEEHNTTDSRPIYGKQTASAYYPRWLQNFVDTLLDPVPQSAKFNRLPGSIPITSQSHPCLTLTSSDPNPSPESAPDPTTTAQVCFQGPEPRLASLQDFNRYITFDDYAPYGSQQIPRTLINSLPANTLLRGHILALEPLRQSDYPLLKAIQYTPPSEKITTTLVPESTALTLLTFNPRLPWPPTGPTSQSTSQTAPMHLYIRTDRTGQVREAYRDPNDHYGLENLALTQALKLKFKPLVIDGIPEQMETALTLP